MKRLLFAVSLTCLSLACGGGSNLLADGGHSEVTGCVKTVALASVRVVDHHGVAVEGAEVTAYNRSSGVTVIAKTDGSGRTAEVNESLGQGYVRITARQNDEVTAPFDVQFICGECECRAFPSSLTLAIPEPPGHHDDE